MTLSKNDGFVFQPLMDYLFGALIRYALQVLNCFYLNTYSTLKNQLKKTTANKYSCPLIGKSIVWRRQVLQRMPKRMCQDGRFNGSHLLFKVANKRMDENEQPQSW